MYNLQGLSGKFVRIEFFPSRRSDGEGTLVLAKHTAPSPSPQNLSRVQVDFSMNPRQGTPLRSTMNRMLEQRYAVYAGFTLRKNHE